LLLTINAETLAIPKDKLGLFPPRAFSYQRTRESFKGKTGVAFDALSVASTASDMTLKFLLHPQRANRLIQQKSLDSNQLSLDGVLKALIKTSFDVTYDDNYLNEIQRMINLNVLKHLMNLASNDNSFFQVKALANEAIRNIMLNSLSLDPYKMQYMLLIKQFTDNPKEFSLPESPSLPDGSPIGTNICNYISY
jgi:hypothetical protein